MFRVNERTVIADYYVICVGRAITHMRALADEAIYRLGLEGVRSLRTEGEDGQDWVLVDFGDVIVHIFSREAREYYNLERLLDPAAEVELSAFFEEMQNKLMEEGTEE
jgi:ribosome-associated protein